jgi:hypothetical protein
MFGDQEKERRRDLRLVCVVICDLIHYYKFSGACGDNSSMSLDGSES